MAADRTFCLGYARHLYAPELVLNKAADSVVRSLVAHRFELPDRERPTTEGIVLWAQDGIGPALSRGREVSERPSEQL